MRIAVVGAELEENLAVRYIRAALVTEGHQVFQVDFNGAEDTEAAARTLVAGGPGNSWRLPPGPACWDARATSSRAATSPL